jgi:hypothetical protein
MVHGESWVQLLGEACRLTMMHAPSNGRTLFLLDKWSSLKEGASRGLSYLVILTIVLIFEEE